MKFSRRARLWTVTIAAAGMVGFLGTEAGPDRPDAGSYQSSSHPAKQTGRHHRRQPHGGRVQAGWQASMRWTKAQFDRFACA